MNMYSGSFKSLLDSHPDFSLESRSKKSFKLRSRLNTTIATATTGTTTTKIPDEEKGRKVISDKSLAWFEQDSSSDSSSDSFHFDSDVSTTSATSSTVTSTKGKQVDVTNNTSVEEKKEEQRRFKLNLAITNAFENNGLIEISAGGLRELPASIADLRHLVALSTPPMTVLPRLFTRSVSTPVGGAPASSSSTRIFQRTASGSMRFNTTSHSQVDSAVPLSIYLPNNFLTASSLPAAFFSLHNLRVLSLRGNQLESLPAGIGRLVGLVDLNLGGNKLRWLPEEITQLPKLERLTLHPNNFLSPPTSAASTSSSSLSSSRLLSPLIIHFRLPSLKEIAYRKLLAYDDFETSLRCISLIPTAHHHLPTHLLYPFVTSLPPLPQRTLRELGSGVVAAKMNYDPLANVCRSVYHRGEEVTFVEPAVERYEWVSEMGLKKGMMNEEEAGEVVEGVRSIPLLRRGCGVKCLDYLEAKSVDTSTCE